MKLEPSFRRGKTVHKSSTPSQSPALAIIRELTDEEANVEALYLWNVNNNEWKSINSTPARWLAPPSEASIGSLWSLYFSPPSDSPELDGERVVDVDRGYESLGEAFIGKPLQRDAPLSKKNLSSSRIIKNREQYLEEWFVDLEAIRRRFFEDGEHFPYTPQRKVFLGVREMFSLSPLQIHQDSAGKWRAQPDAEIKILERLDPQKHYQRLVIDDNERFLIRPHYFPLQIIADADFRTDDDLARDYLQVLETPIGESAEDLATELLRQRLSSVAATHAPAAIYQALRLNEAMARASTLEDIRAQIRERLLASPAVQEIMEGIKDSVRAATEKNLSALRQAAKEKLKATRAKRKQAEREAALYQADTQRLSKEADVAREEVARLKAEVAEEVDARIARISADVAGRILAANTPPAAPNVKRSSSVLYPFSNSETPREVDDVPGALSKLTRRCAAAGVEEGAAAPMLAALAVGLRPVVLGPAAPALLCAASDAFFGGRRLERTVSPLVVEFRELFGRVYPGTGAYRPDPSQLADLFICADQTNELHLIVFDGFNRADAEALFSHLLSAPQAHDSQRLSLVHPNEIPADDPYAPLAQATWPKHFIPAFRYATGFGQPLSTFGSQSATVLATFNGKGPTGLAPLSSLPASILDTIKQNAERQAADAKQAINGIPASLRCEAAHYGADRATAERFCAALMACGVPADSAATMTRNALLLTPLLLAGVEAPDVNEAELKPYRAALGQA